MIFTRNASRCFLAAMLVSVGCSESKKSPSTSATKNETAPSAASESTEHSHGAGPNGGVVFDLGGSHAEFTVDHSQQQCLLLVLGDDEKTPAPIAASELILNIKETKTADGKPVPAMTVTMKPEETKDGKASKFVGSDPGLGNVADFAGTVSGEVDGKPAQGEFEE